MLKPPTPQVHQTPPAKVSRGFVGRRADLKQLAQLWSTHRIVGIIGGPGVGKTRLTFEYLKHQPGPVFFCDVADCHSAEELCDTVMGALGLCIDPVSGDSADSADRLEALIAQWQRVESHPAIAALAPPTIVIDAAEDCIPAVKVCLQRWTRASQRVRFLVTSRRPLQLPEGNEIVLAPMNDAVHPWSKPELWVDRGGRRFRLSDGREVSLRHRPPLTRVLAGLARSRVRNPGDCLSVDDLVPIGWPGEQLLRDTGKNRVYVAIATLRKMGLSELLLKTEKGYLLDPDSPIRVD